MSDPRNAAHDRKVSEEKKHQGTEESPEHAHAAQQGKKAPAAKDATASETPPQTDAGESTPASTIASPEAAARHEGTLALLTQLKDMEFHSRANLERLAEMMLTVDTLKQKAFVEPVGEVFSLQDAFQTKLTALIDDYKKESDRMPDGSA